MKTPIWPFVAVFAVAVSCAWGTAQAATPEEMVDNVQWLGKQASVRIAVGDTVIYLDPYQMDQEPHDADLVLLTHDHQDHCSPEDVDKVSNEETLYLAIPSCLDKFSEPLGDSMAVKPGINVDKAGIRVETVPAYNVEKTQFHSKTAGHVGYVLTIDGVRIYHAGDTERIPEMKDFTCDIALLPLGQTYTMSSVEEAAQAVLDLKATIAIPMHYGMYEGTPEDAQRFKKILEGKARVDIQK